MDERLNTRGLNYESRPKPGDVSPRVSGCLTVSSLTSVRCYTNRNEFGDVEADFIVSGKTGSGILLTVVDRKIRHGLIRKILPRHYCQRRANILDAQRAFPELTSITTDNDILLRYHQRLEALLGVPIYFCDPYSSWQKGTLNYNKQVRSTCPKGWNSQYGPFASLEYVKK